MRASTKIAVIGIVMVAVAGMLWMSSSSGIVQGQGTDVRTATPTRSATPTPTATATPSPEPTATPVSPAPTAEPTDTGAPGAAGTGPTTLPRTGAGEGSETPDRLPFVVVALAGLSLIAAAGILRGAGRVS